MGAAMAPEEDLDTKQRAFVETLCCSSPEAEKAREIALEFKELSANGTQS